MYLTLFDGLGSKGYRLSLILCYLVDGLVQQVLNVSPPLREHIFNAYFEYRENDTRNTSIECTSWDRHLESGGHTRQNEISVTGTVTGIQLTSSLPLDQSFSPTSISHSTKPLLITLCLSMDRIGLQNSCICRS